MHSISARLTLLYTLVVLVAIALLATVVTWKLSTDLAAGHLRFLQEKTVELQTDLQDGHGNPAVVLAEIDKETTDKHVRQYLARVLTVDDRPLGATPGMRLVLPTQRFPATLPTPTDARTQWIGGHAYVLTTVLLQTSTMVEPLHLQIALDVTRDARLLMDVRRVMWLAFAVLVPLLAVAGYWVSARGLAPLARITGAARDVNPTHLSARIPTHPPWPSELGELVTVFNAMLMRLEDGFSRLSRFSADLAHELRTPLSNMRGALEVCLLRPRSAAEYREALESNLEECRRLGALIDNLLFMARADRAGAALHKETFDGAEASMWAIAQLADGARTRGIRIERSGQADITADPVMFRQALVNLLANAIQHSKVEGTVQVALRSDAEGTSEVRVIDHGVGVGAEHLPHLFDRFYQVDSSRAREGGNNGTGLGLAIVKAIVDLHGGKVSLESTPGVGTVAVMQFPFSDDVQPARS